jgi:hypothetical protein
MHVLHKAAIHSVVVTAFANGPLASNVNVDGVVLAPLLVEEDLLPVRLRAKALQASVVAGSHASDPRFVHMKGVFSRLRRLAEAGWANRKSQGFVSGYSLLEKNSWPFQRPTPWIVANLCICLLAVALASRFLLKSSFRQRVRWQVRRILSSNNHLA